MRFKIIAAVTLILLGIVVFSAYSGSDYESTQDDEDIIQKIEVNNSSFLEFSKDRDGFKSVVVDNDNLRKATANEIEEKHMSVADENNIFKEIKLDNSSIKVPESCDHFETVIVNPEKFRELALNGTLNLSLMGEDYELKLQETKTRKPDIISYSGYIVGKPQSSAFFTVKNDSINGCINVDFYTLSYGISSTDEKYDGKIVHLLRRYYNEGAEEKLEKQYSLDPLRFSISNSDKERHEVCIELLNFYNQTIFKQTYTMNPGDRISSTMINAELGLYRYEIILDNDFTCEQTVRADYAAELGSSEKLYIYITDDPDNPIKFGIEVS
jgi:hypothetical protein